MSNYRKIAPLQDITSRQVNPYPSASVGVQPETGSPRKKRVRHTDAEWNMVKPLILDLYQHHRLEDVVKEVKRRTGFEAGIRQYKNMLAIWEVPKYINEGHRGFILGNSRKRKREGRESTEYLVRGVQLEEQDLQRLQARYDTGNAASQHLSPFLQVTPEDIEYYSPIALHRSGIVTAPNAFSPAAKLSRYAAEFNKIVNKETKALSLLAFNTTPQPIKKIVALPGITKHKEIRARHRQKAQSLAQEQSRRERRVERQKHLSKQPFATERKVHHHVKGTIETTGCGRFFKDRLLHSILWQGHDLALAARDCLERCEDAHHDVTPVVSARPGASKRPQYSVVAAPADFAPRNLSMLLDFIKSSKVIQLILGLSKSNHVHWADTWQPMNSQETASLYQITNHLLGDLVQAYPTCQVLSVCVSLATGAAASKPLILRVSMAQSIEERTSGCPQCTTFSLMIDLIGSAGAFKLRMPLAEWGVSELITSWKAFCRVYRLKTETGFGLWPKTAAVLDGIQVLKHYRRCYCNGAVHDSGFRKHYIDMQDEIERRNECWNPNPEDVQARTFESFPPLRDIDLCVIENNDSSDNESENEHWDPCGNESHIAETFEPYPSDDSEEDSYLSKPYFFKVHS